MQARSSPQIILLLLLLFVNNMSVIDAFITSPRRQQGPFAAADRNRRVRVPVSTTIINIPLEMKKKKDASDADASSANDDKTERNKQIVSSVLFPLIALFGLDLLLNIAIITKKVVLTYVTGQDQVSPPWW
jgi:hypothetical protein